MDEMGSVNTHNQGVLGSSTSGTTEVNSKTKQVLEIKQISGTLSF
jgi:hypothetical protein